MERTEWKIEGMTCSNCALTISKFLEKKGLHDIKLNPVNGDLSFHTHHQENLQELKSGIEDLGYHVMDPGASATVSKNFFSTNKGRFLFTLPFTLILSMHMFDGLIHLHWLMNPWIQCLICLPVFITGMWYFGRSALKSLRNGMPNMDMLITLGALAAFLYSLTGAIMRLGDDYLFFETTATIITLVFFGNYLEEASVNSTQKIIRELAKSQKVMAHLIAFDDQYKEQIFPIENSNLKKGDLILIKNGELVPSDCKIIWGECTVNESIITGESLPVHKQKKDLLIGGSVLTDGTIKAQVTATGRETVLSGILQMVQMAQAEKPPMQKMADRISAVFVPVVIGISLLTFIANFYFFSQDSGQSLMRAVAVLVIACPCAMGIATPAAIAVGLGRGAKKGILFKNASTLESFKTIKQVVFDKTGTLTTGKFTIAGFETTIDNEEFKRIVYSLEKFSNHPIAISVSNEWKDKHPLKWQHIEETKGIGIKATDGNGNLFEAGSYKILRGEIDDARHSIYVLKNGSLIGSVDMKDEIRSEASAVVKWLHQNGIKTILLSGDRVEKCKEVAVALGIDEVMAEKLPSEKMEVIANLNSISPVAMIGDGINDAPALAKATLGISLSEASQIAIQSSDVILMNHGLKHLPLALGLGKQTYITIKQNLFWAFFYNIIAIPVASVGLLTPSFAALAMGLSDVVLAANSARLFVKKVI
jgi:P-type Cu+ transporter